MALKILSIPYLEKAFYIFHWKLSHLIVDGYEILQEFLINRMALEFYAVSVNSDQKKNCLYSF